MHFVFAGLQRDSVQVVTLQACSSQRHTLSRTEGSLIHFRIDYEEAALNSGYLANIAQCVLEGRVRTSSLSM